MARPRRFDEPALLDAATDLFWSNGFDRTSVDDVSAATGVGNGSIYAAYGSKKGLFLRLFERYCEQRAEFVCEAVKAPGSVASAVSAYFEAVIADCAAQPGRRGCLMINSMAQLGTRVPEVVAITRRTTERMESGVAARIRAAASRPGPADEEIEVLAAHIVLVSQGLIQLSRQGVSAERLRAIAETSRAGLPSYCAA
ncbi:TetR/AcrR family transcriptional regulator [Actinomadura nitritigenes]|uniref:TetR/AcrR family transcriptional regulator n=1 Tax=Actinomadura TaxID=1988 RepID=UPI001689A282|nr:TetR/AcrR family transcriptional regulator [Actinomadura sp. RB99]MBD2891664.1 HTH-type transcriptional repressor ComR [Actinomadura sp. RB99]